MQQRRAAAHAHGCAGTRINSKTGKRRKKPIENGLFRQRKPFDQQLKAESGFTVSFDSGLGSPSEYSCGNSKLPGTRGKPGPTGERFASFMQAIPSAKRFRITFAWFCWKGYIEQRE